MRNNIFCICCILERDQGAWIYGLFMTSQGFSGLFNDKNSLHIIRLHCSHQIIYSFFSDGGWHFLKPIICGINT